MYLISTANTTVLTAFNDLETKFIYQHSNGENRDFQFYPQQPIFVEVNKKSGLEIMRIKETAQKFDIQRVQKLTIDNVFCVACAKQSLEEIAVGLANGQVKLYNYNKSEFIHKFNADSSRNSVLYLDYNASDEYIAGVFENGSINIYGHKTKTKIETFNIDDNSTLARFHPSKRFQLSIASYKGAVTIYDIQSKRKLFHLTEAHAAQCSDLCMSPASPDTLISVGYDCVINIFDTRRKVKPVQLMYSHPLSSVTASECGTYFCVGNLKGELTTYDIRNTKLFLASQKVHDCAVTRVLFAPQANNSGTSCSSPAGGAENSLSNLATVIGNTGFRKSIATNLVQTESVRTNRDSFCDFLDFQANRVERLISPQFLSLRDSFDWDVLSRKPLSDENRMQLDEAIANNILVTHIDSFDNEAITKYQQKNFNSTSSRSSSTRELAQIMEKENLVQEETKSSNKVLTSEGTKESTNCKLEHPTKRLKSLPVSFNSKPHERTSMQTLLGTSESTPGAHVTSTAIKNDELKEESSHFKQSILELRAEMLQRFDQMEFEIKFLVENNKWQTFGQNFNLWNQRSAEIEEIRQYLGIILHRDTFVNEFMRLKEENELLKKQLQNGMQK